MPDSPTRSSDPAPSKIVTRSDFAAALTVLRERVGLTVRDVAKTTAMQASTVGGYFSGRHLPPLKPPSALPDILRACGVTDPTTVEEWEDALRRVRRAPGRRPADAPIPYRGLASFQPDDADWFFGREALTETLVQRITKPAAGGEGVLLVVGPSGAGKSSLLRAGLVAALGHHETADETADDAANDAPNDAADDAADDAPAGPTGPPRCVLLTPGAHPMRSLSAALPAAVVVIDQFEEVFTACTEEEERLEFIAAICALTSVDPDSGCAPMRAVLGLRADFYPQLLNHPELFRTAQNAQLVVGPMSEPELRRAIEAPAHKARADIQPGLVELVLRDLVPAGRDSGAAYEAGALPLLAHALLATWERGKGRSLTVAGYAESGGIRGAVAQTAEQVYEQLTEEQREAARRLFVRLVIVSDDAADARRRVHIAEFADDQAVSEIIDLFVDHRLITADIETLEISHETLIRAWPRLRGWIDADRAHLLVRQEVADAAQKWEQEHHDPGALYRGTRLAAAKEWAGDAGPLAPTPLQADFIRTSLRHERRRLRRLYQTVAGLAALLLVAVGAGVVAVQQRAEATQERNAAISRLVATRADRVRDKDVALAAQLSLAAYRISPTAEALASLLDNSATYTATRLLGGPGVMQAVALTPDRRTLAAGGLDRTVRLWDVSDPRRPIALGQPLTGPTDTVFAVAFSPDGKTLAAGGGDKAVHLWDIRDPGQPVPTGAPLTGPTALIYSLAFSPDGKTLAAGSGDMVVHRWEVASPGRAEYLGPPLAGATSYIQSVAYSPNGEILAAGSDDRTVRLWDVRDPRQPRPLGEPLVGPTRRIYTVAFSPDGRTLAAGSADSNVYRWDLADPGRPVALGDPISGLTGWVNAVAFSPDGTTMAFASSASAVRLWSISTQQLTATLPHPGPVTGVAFHSDDTVVTSAADGTARIWHLPGPVLTGHGDIVNGVAFSPDGRTLAIGSGETQLWDVNGRDPLAVSMTNTARFSSSIAYAPDGSTLAVGSRDGTVQLWNVSDAGTPIGDRITGRSARPRRGVGGVQPGRPHPRHRQRRQHRAPVGRFQPLRAAAAGDTRRVQLLRLLGGVQPGRTPPRRRKHRPDGAALGRHRPTSDPNASGSPCPAPTITCSPWRSARTAARWRWAAPTRRSGSSTWPTRPHPSSSPVPWAVRPTTSTPSRSAGTDGRWRRPTPTRRSGCGTSATGSSQRPSRRSPSRPDRSTRSPSIPTDTRWPAAVAAGRSGCGRPIPQRVIAQICATAGDPITATEWQRYVPGLDYQAPCANA